MDYFSPEDWEQQVVRAAVGVLVGQFDFRAKESPAITAMFDGSGHLQGNQGEKERGVVPYLVIWWVGTAQAESA